MEDPVAPVAGHDQWFQSLQHLQSVPVDADSLNGAAGLLQRAAPTPRANSGEMQSMSKISTLGGDQLVQDFTAHSGDWSAGRVVQQEHPAQYSPSPVTPSRNTADTPLQADVSLMQPYRRSSAAQTLNPSGGKPEGRRSSTSPRAEVLGGTTDAGVVRQRIPGHGERHASSLPGGHVATAGVQSPYKRHHGWVQRTVRVGPSGSAWVTVQQGPPAEPVRAASTAGANRPRMLAEQHEGRERVASWLAGSSRTHQGDGLDAPRAELSAPQHEHAQQELPGSAHVARRPSWRTRSGSPPTRLDLGQARRLSGLQPLRRRRSASPVPGGGAAEREGRGGERGRAAGVLRGVAGRDAAPGRHRPQGHPAAALDVLPQSLPGALHEHCSFTSGCRLVLQNLRPHDQHEGLMTVPC